MTAEKFMEAKRLRWQNVWQGKRDQDALASLLGKADALSASSPLLALDLAKLNDCIRNTDQRTG